MFCNEQKNLKVFYNTIINECFRNIQHSNIDYNIVNDDIYIITFTVYNNYTVVVKYNSCTSVFNIKIHSCNIDEYILNINYLIDNTTTKMFELIKNIIQFDYLVMTN